MKIIISFVIILVLHFSAYSNEPNWYVKFKQIKPLITSREEVEKLFSFPRVKTSFIDAGIEVVFYETEEGKLTVYYSAGECSSEIRVRESEEDKFVKGYKTTKGNVVYTIFFPKTKIKFSRVKNNKSKLYKSRDGDDPAWTFSNDELGIGYSVMRGKVFDAYLYPLHKDNYLMCEGK